MEEIIHISGEIIPPEKIDGDITTNNIDGEIGDTTVLGTEDHRKLQHRDDEDQHPIGAITDLNEELGARVSTALTNEDIFKILST